jgi:hypothetical protein
MTLIKTILSVIGLIVTPRLNTICTKCHYADCHCAECQSADCHYADCHYADCHYAECRHAGCHYSAFQIYEI